MFQNIKRPVIGCKENKHSLYSNFRLLKFFFVFYSFTGNVNKINNDMIIIRVLLYVNGISYSLHFISSPHTISKYRGFGRGIMYPDYTLKKMVCPEFVGHVSG